MDRQDHHDKAGDVLDAALVGRYLAILGVGSRKPSLEALNELVAAHLRRVPFENISKLYRWKRAGFAGLPPLPMFLDGIEQYHFGGTCYANNFHLYSLLASLGYDAKLCGADMANPDVHMVCLVRVEGREFLVDAGYGAPFLAPLPRDLAADHVIEWGSDRYFLQPQDAHGCSRLELHRDGMVKHGYLVKPAPRKVEDFASVIAHSFRPEATFLNAVLLARFERHRSVVIHNLAVTRTRGGQSVLHPLEDRDELAAAIEQEFGIPQAITAEALGDMVLSQDAWE